MIILSLMVRSSPPGKFVFKSWQVVISTSGAFKSIWLEQEVDAPFLPKIQQDFKLCFNKMMKNVHLRFCFFVYLFSL